MVRTRLTSLAAQLVGGDVDADPRLREGRQTQGHDQEVPSARAQSARVAAIGAGSVVWSTLAGRVEEGDATRRTLVSGVTPLFSTVKPMVAASQLSRNSSPSPPAMRACGLRGRRGRAGGGNDAGRVAHASEAGRVRADGKHDEVVLVPGQQVGLDVRGARHLGDLHLAEGVAVDAFRPIDP